MAGKGPGAVLRQEPSQLLATIIAASLTAFSPASAEAAPHAPWQYGHRLSGSSMTCLLKNEGAFLTKWLGSIEGSAVEQKLSHHLNVTFPACFMFTPTEKGWFYDFDDGAMRAALIDGLMRPHLSTLAETSPSGFDQPHWFGDLDLAGRDKAAREAVVANDFGFCVAKTDWTHTRDLLRSEEGSASEATAIAKLTPSLGGCIPQAMRLVLDRPRLRAILLEVTFHALGPASAMVTAS